MPSNRGLSKYCCMTATSCSNGVTDDPTSVAVMTMGSAVSVSAWLHVDDTAVGDCASSILAGPSGTAGGCVCVLQTATVGRGRKRHEERA